MVVICGNKYMDTWWVYEYTVCNGEIVQTVLVREGYAERLYCDARYNAVMVGGGCGGKDTMGSGKWCIIKKI